jgi:hypothetical protein
MDFSFFTTDNKSGYKTNEKWLSKNHNELYNQINHYCEKLDLNLSFKEKIWFFFNNLIQRPQCKTCGNEIKFRERFDNPYGDFCSLTCINSNKKEMIERQKKTFQKKYGIDFYPNHVDFVKKQKTTKKNKYGDENYNNFIKAKQTKKEKYGYENYNNLNKQKNTIKLKYGSDNISKSNWYKKNIFEKFKNKYGNLNILSITEQMVNIKCNKCDNDYEITKQLLYERYKRNYDVCTHCNPIGQSSRSGHEKELNDYLNELNVNTIQSYRELPNNLEVDIFIPEKNIGIEINGLYWHNELFKKSEYHLRKHNICKDKNIELIQIFEDEWLYKKDIVKSILKNRLNLIENKIYSRKCVIKEVNNEISKTFLNENHIQGNVNSKIKLGLFYNDELVSLMTFSKGRIIMGGKENEWELTRFCNKRDYVVVGASSKLFKYFLTKYNPYKIISYSDIRLFDGNMYNNLGFNKELDSKPNYWYVINDIRHYRFNFRKSNLIKLGFDKDKTEKEIMFNRGIYRVYDCGNTRWVFENKTFTNGK